MIYTGLDLITDSMREIGAVSEEEPISAADAALGLRRLNGMIGFWGANNLMVRATVTENFPLTAGTTNYTIGTGQTFNTLKPYRIVSAFVRDLYNEDTPLDIISKDEYMALTDKTVSPGRPESLYFDPGLTQQAAQVGTIVLNPPPDSSTPYTLFIDSDKQLTEIATINTTITFEPVYYEALLYNLAERLWTIYHDDQKPVKPDLKISAARSRAMLENLNSKNVLSRTDVPGTKKGIFNIYRDEYNG